MVPLTIDLYVQKTLMHTEISGLDDGTECKKMFIMLSVYYVIHRHPLFKVALVTRYQF